MKEEVEVEEEEEDVDDDSEGKEGGEKIKTKMI
jgi:hypothetical protein